MTSAPCCKRKPRAATVVGAAVLPTVAFALLPKCPMCVAAYLAFIGITIDLAPAVRPVAFLAIFVAMAAAWAMSRRRSS